MPKRYLITSALPYINGIKHLGNLVGSMLPADVYARYLRKQGHEVLFICATDEHGTPAELAALASGLTVEEYCRVQHELQRDACQKFSLSFDHFGRSSSPQNHVFTKYFAKKLEENGFITERSTKQIYAIDDARYLPDRYVIGTCPYCGYAAARGDQCESCTRVLDPVDLISPRSVISGSTHLEIRESRHLFLLQSKLTSQLRSWIESKKEWPPLVTSIAKKWLNEGLNDRAITRDLDWGVPVDRPGFENKVYYVWFDAPIEYISATKEWSDLDPQNRNWESWWHTTEDVHYTQFMAKDNVPFHTIFFPAVILGVDDGWKQPDYIKAFNWLTYERGKFSTSQDRGVFMLDALDLLPADYWRYWLLANAPESDDADFTWEVFGVGINADLVATFGNFVNRILKFSSGRFGAFLPKSDLEDDVLELNLYRELSEKIASYESNLETLSFRKALKDLKEIWRAGNVYLAEAEPWKLPKNDPRCSHVINVGLKLIQLFAILSEPIIPETSTRILTAFSHLPSERRWPHKPIRDFLCELATPERIPVLDLLFLPIEAKTLAEWKHHFSGHSV